MHTALGMSPLPAAVEMSPVLQKGQGMRTGWLFTLCRQQLQHGPAVLQWKSPEEDSLVEMGRGGEMYLCHVLFYLVPNMNKQ